MHAPKRVGGETGLGKALKMWSSLSFSSSSFSSLSRLWSRYHEKEKEMGSAGLGGWLLGPAHLSRSSMICLEVFCHSKKSSTLTLVLFSPFTALDREYHGTKICNIPINTIAILASHSVWIFWSNDCNFVFSEAFSRCSIGWIHKKIQSRCNV